MSKFIDLTGQKFGHLTAKYFDNQYINSNGKKVSVWWCECDCGNPDLIPVYGCHLKDGHTKHCNKCIKYEDLIGQTFGNWLVLRKGDDYISPKGEKCIQWVCECQCEDKTIHTIRADILKNGNSQSCGCLKKNTYDLSNEYGIGYDCNGLPFYFDLEDYEKVKQYTWHRDKHNYLCADCFRNGINTTIKMHRLVLDILDDNRYDGDHIKHRNYDNRKSQLRKVNNSQNSMNTKTPKTNTSGYKGVCFDKSRNKYEAYIKINGKKKHLGRYENKEDANKARMEAEELYFGEYSYKNSMNHDSCLNQAI